uniref:(California timema) hypothetical protein n=1 Tax=Timema californicum TaxID=61474 RepID=A0A7R9J2Z7_TIMCA|nr:unnamed protein product [Timema californicum]
MSLRPPPHTPSAPLIPQSSDKVATYMLDKEGDRENKERRYKGQQRERAGFINSKYARNCVEEEWIAILLKAPSLHPTKIRTSIFPSSAV